MRPERLISHFSPHSVDWKKVSTGGEPEWTPADAALACAGLEERAAAAFRYRWARDESVFKTLRAALLKRAKKRAAQNKWPAKVINYDGDREPYLERLVDLALLEEHRGFDIQRNAAWPRIMNVTDRVWFRVLCPRYEDVRHPLTVWNDIAAAHIRRKLR